MEEFCDSWNCNVPQRRFLDIDCFEYVRSVSRACRAKNYGNVGSYLNDRSLREYSVIPFWNSYALVLSSLLNGQQVVEETNRRTGEKIRALPEGASFVIDLSNNVLPTIGSRKTFPHIAAAEVAWCLRGDNHIDWLRKHTKVWDAFADVVDCEMCGGSGYVPNSELKGELTCPNCDGSGKTYWLDAAYGYRWRTKFGRDQLQLAIDALKADPTDRRIWISSWDATMDGLGAPSKTVPCPVGFTLSILENRLNSTFMIRSSDIYHGLPYDVMRHAFLMRAISASLRCQLGMMRVTLAHPHLYGRHYNLARQMMTQPIVTPKFVMASYWSVGHISEDADVYVLEAKTYASELEWPEFNPKSEVVR